MAKENPFLMASAMEMFMAEQEGTALQRMEKAHPTLQASQVYRFYLGCRQFAALGKLFLK